MTSATESLGHGFRTVAERPELILIDLFAKAVWFSIAIVCLALAFAAAASRLTIDPALAAALSGAPIPVDGLIQAVGRPVVQLFRALGAGGIFALLVWMPIEAFVRAGVAPWGRDSFFRDACRNFQRFFISGLLRRAVLLATGVAIALPALGPLLTAPAGEWSRVWQEARPGAALGAVFFLSAAAFLSVLETAARNRPAAASASAPGRLIRIAAVVAVTLGLEWSILGAVALGGGVVIWTAGAPAMGVLFLGAWVALATVVHSVLLLVRYAAVARMEMAACAAAAVEPAPARAGGDPPFGEAVGEGLDHQ